MSKSLPLRDIVAKLFLYPSNLIMTTLLKSHPVKVAHQRSIAAMHKNFLKMSSSGASYEEQYSARWLWSNMRSQVIYGDIEAKV